MAYYPSSFAALNLDEVQHCRQHRCLLCKAVSVVAQRVLQELCSFIDVGAVDGFTLSV